LIISALENRAPVSSRGRAVEQLARPSVQVMGLRILGAGTALAAQVFASRVTGSEEFGRYALVLVYLLLLGHSGTMGTAQLVCRLLAEYVQRGQPGPAHGLLRFALACTLLVSIGLYGLAAAALHTPILAIDPSYVPLASLVLLGIPLLALQDFLEAVARGLDRPTLGIGPAFIVRHLAIIVGLGAVVGLGQAAGAATIACFTLAGLLASVLIQAALLARHLARIVGHAAPVYHIRSWLRTSLPLAGVDAAEVLFFNADILILGLFLPPESVALYFAASRLAQLLAYVPYSVTAVTAQKYAALAAAGDTPALQALVRRSARLSSAFALLAALALWMISPALLSLFGPDYGAAGFLVPVLCLGIVLACLFGPGEDVLSMLGEERLCALGFWMALAVNIAAGLCLVPHLGPLGAAIAMGAGLAVRGVLLAWFAFRRLGLLLPVFLPLGRRNREGLAQ